MYLCGYPEECSSESNLSIYNIFENEFSNKQHNNAFSASAPDVLNKAHSLNIEIDFREAFILLLFKALNKAIRS